MMELGLDGTTGSTRLSGEGSEEDFGGAGGRLAFGEWIFAPATGELWRADSEQSPLLLRPQLRCLLVLLSARPGELVTRKEIHHALWGERVVDLDRGLNFCVRQLRETLGDDARRPKYVETLPRLGYRFVARVAMAQSTGDPEGEGGPQPGMSLQDETEVGKHPPDSVEREFSEGSTGRNGGRRSRVPWIVGSILLVALAGILVLAMYRHHVTVPDPEPAQLSDPAFREALETGRLLMQRGLDSLPRAEQALALAVTLAPDSAEAWAELSKAHLLMAEKDVERYDAAQAAVRRSLELDPDLPLAHIRRADLLSLRDHDWSAAEASYRRALELDPGQVEALHCLSFALSLVGRDEEALATMERARFLDPMSTLLVGDAVALHLFARRYEVADELARKLIELRPEIHSLHVMRIYLLEQLEKWPEAGEAARVLAVLDGRPLPFHPTDAASLRDFWRWRLEELRSETGSQARLARAGIHAHLGDPSAALDELEAVAAAGSYFLAFQLRDPRFESLYKEPRFRALLDQVGLSGVPWAI